MLPVCSWYAYLHQWLTCVVYQAVILIITQAGCHCLLSHLAYSAADLLHEHLCALHSAAQINTATIVKVGTL